MPALSHLHMDPEQPVPGAADGMLVGSLPTEAVDAFINAAGPSAAFPLLTAEIRHLGGELARPAPATARWPASTPAMNSTPPARPQSPTSPARAPQIQTIKGALAP